MYTIYTYAWCLPTWVGFSISCGRTRVTCSHIRFVHFFFHFISLSSAITFVCGWFADVLATCLFKLATIMCICVCRRTHFMNNFHMWWPRSSNVCVACAPIKCCISNCRRRPANARVCVCYSTISDILCGGGAVVMMRDDTLRCGGGVGFYWVTN